MMSQKKRKSARTSFGATAPPFLDYLKDILRRYPDGGQILKELIQNADDAQATDVVFIHDERCYGCESLWTDELGKYQGPALYAYNNAAFSDDDWERIQKAGRSGKLNDPNKIGRFGIGFNSVYHITDVPSIFSSGHLGWMDPQENIFGERNGGFLWSFDNPEHQEALMTMYDQFQPFRDIVSLVGKQGWSKVVKEDKHFDGTVFRFPLRNKASEISDNLYDSNKVVELFDSFAADSDLSLLFLKNVNSVSLIHVHTDGSVDTRLKVKSSAAGEVVSMAGQESAIEGFSRFKEITLSSGDHKETQECGRRWLVTTCTMKEGKDKDLDVLAKKLSFLPRVDLAFPCGEEKDACEGRLSCFLPLPNNEPNKTGLPVHVNACFGLTDNRRHIKWQEEDQKHDEHALWNELLVKKMLPQAYLKILQDAIKLSQQSSLSVSSVYSLWPDIAQMQHKEKWRTVALDLFDHLFRYDLAVLSLAKDETQFIPLSKAVLPCNGPTNTTISSAIKRTLVSCGENLVTFPASVLRAIESYTHHTTTNYVTPSFLRKVIHRTSVHYIPADDKLCLLEYILSDGKYRELRGLQLLPLSDGSFRSFTDKEEDTALIDSAEFPRVLLPYCKHLFIPETLSQTCRTHLENLAKQNLFKVINIEEDDVAEYTRRYLPQDWKQSGTALVTWDSSNSQHPPLDWLQTFWRFLNNHFQQLSGFNEIPLIPVGPLSVSRTVLAKLQQNTTLIFHDSKQSRLPDQIAQLVTKVGGTVVSSKEWLRHEDLSKYVLSPSPRSVMEVLKNLDSDHLIRSLTFESLSAQEGLKDYLSQLNSLSSREKDLLSMLPLFKTMKGLCVAAKSKQAVLLMSSPRLPSELPVPDSVIQCATAADRRLLELMGVDLLGPPEAAMLLIGCIEKGYRSNAETETIMTWILQHGNILFSQNPSLKSKCRNLRFIEVNGELKNISSFLDPRKERFRTIFEANFFPSPAFTKTQQMLESLTDLGLITKAADIKPEHWLRVATVIDCLSVDSHTKALEKSHVFLDILNANDLLSKFSREQLNCLKKLKWLPGDQPGDEKRQVCDQSQKCCFYCPEEIRHPMYENIIGHVMPVTGKLIDKVSKMLGLQCLPPPKKVIENLSVVKSKAKEIADDPDTNVSFKRQLHAIYGHMQDNISSFEELLSKETCWLWAHSQFVKPQDLVLEYPRDLDLSSYIEKVPKEYLPYKRLLQKFGLRKSLSREDIFDILHSIQEKVEARQQPFASPAEVKVSIEILNWLWREKVEVEDDIPVPVILEEQQFSLKPHSEALLCDVSESSLQELQFSKEGMYILHEEIPIATAEWLKIQFLSNFILAPEVVGIEQCGQFEPITTRIKNILKEYDEESDIFKELIQNADDAGAEECKFLLDYRVHNNPPESLIDPGMALCQGPCLWAFNNEQFSAEDWENVVRVGSASKENKVEKIGKFGLGFNTVYHVTDVPSILSGNKLLILDPNVSHLKKHIRHKTNPGIKLDLSQKRHFRLFPGYFGPYEQIFDCSFTDKSSPEPYMGTLIRLPFRSVEEAHMSEISTKVFHEHDIVALQENFTISAQTHLLFLKNVNTLSLQSISNNASTPPRDEEIETILTVSKTPVTTMRVTDESEQCQAEELLMENVNVRCKEVIDSSTINIVEIDSQQAGKTEKQLWLLYNCFGTHQSLKMALNGNKKAKFSLPMGGIAVPLQIKQKSQKLSPLQTHLVGQAFCFLPLPIHTGLPVNINGTFAVMSNRKGLWESGVKSEWNKALLRDPVVRAYLTSLLALKEMSQNDQLEMYRYHTFWPDREKVTDTFKPLVDAFYSAIAQWSNGPELLSDGEHWCSMNNTIFLHESIEEDPCISSIAFQVCKKYTKATGYVVHLPLWLRNNFKQAGLGEVLESRTWTWEKFYQEGVFKNLETLDPKSRDTLVLHAIDLNVREIDNLLKHYPCIPTTDGQLQYIHKLVNPSGRAACLFGKGEGRLLGGSENDFCSAKRVQRLLELGMAHDDLLLEDIENKACTMTKTWKADQKKAYTHLKCLLELMRSHIHDRDAPLWERLKTIAFLPAFSPGDVRMERNATLQKPTNVFTDRDSHLVNMKHHVLNHAGLKIHHKDPLLEVLGVRSSPEPTIVLQQLHEAWRQSQSIDGSVLHKLAHECYKFLDQWISGCEDTTSISRCANAFPFVLFGKTFVNVKSVAENGSFDAKPYLYILPPAFGGFKNLWQSVGLQEKFTTSQFLTVLEELHSQHGNKPLPESDLSICLTVLSKGIFEANNKTTSDCLIPNEHGVLQPAKELHFNDSPWMPVAPELTLCHANIPRKMALHFGIKTTRHHTLEGCTTEMSPYSFPFEQHEQLTVRIKNILSAYPSKRDIIKELIQNADDAEATEIHFVWDKRQHGKEKTFGPKWNRLQGPALCVFNNKVFSNDDLEGIQHLGEGGKHNSPGKIGKYGVGFNSVYHLTDCPSIITGDELLGVFDPNRKYIDCHTDKPPAGAGYKLLDTFKEMYEDVYKSFLPDKFSLREGTMFRLPLRDSATASKSKISQQEITDKDMTELFSALTGDPEGLILFLKNISKIEIHVISERSGKLERKFVVEKSLPPDSREEKDAFVNQLQAALRSERHVTPHKVLYETTISTSDKRQSKWIIAEEFGSFKDADKERNKLPQGVIAARVSTKSPNPSQSTNLMFKGAAFCSLPLPGETGLPVHISGNFEVDAGRKNLWIEDGQSHKSNWNESLKQNLIAPLYADLLYYIKCKIAVKPSSSKSIELHLSTSYLCFWPTASKDVGPVWHEMIYEVYRSVKKKGLDVIPVLRSSTQKLVNREHKVYSINWCNLSQTEVTEVPYLMHSEYDSINPILENLGMKLVPTSMKMSEIWRDFRSAGIDVKSATPAAVRTFLKTKALNDPTQTDEDLPLPITATLIKDETRCSQLLTFCLDDFRVKNTKQSPPSLDGLPLLLTSDKMLRMFDSKSPKHISRYESIFLYTQDRFADYETNKSHIDSLKVCNLVESLTLPQAAKHLKPLIRVFLQECDVDIDSCLPVPNENMLKWLNFFWRFIFSEITSGGQKGPTLSDVKKIFSDCCILPVVCPRSNNQHCLQTMQNMPSVVHSASEWDISLILFKLGFVKVNSAFFSKSDRKVICLLNDELMDVNDKTSVLDQVCKINSSEFSHLSSEDFRIFQEFLQSVRVKSEHIQEYKRKLKSLPLFQTVQGERVRIDGPAEVFVLNSIHSGQFPDLFSLSNAHGIFLKYNSENRTLSDMLNIAILDDLQYFMRFILPAVHRLNEKQLLHCLQLLLSLKHFDQHKDKIMSSLKTVKLIRSSQGNLETASYYFDDHVELYKRMAQPERFVPKKFWCDVAGEPYKEGSARKMIRDLGMRHEVSTDDIINFAYQLEAAVKGNCKLEELKQKSTLLLRETLQKVSKDIKKEAKLLGKIADIKFIFPVKIREELCNYHQPFASQRTTVPIRGSLIERNQGHQDLIWSSMPIIHLPVYISPNLLQEVKHAGAHENPPSDCVTRNIRNICQSPCETEPLIRTRANVFRSAYAYLQAKGFDGQSLAALPVVLVEEDTQLFKPEAVCLSLFHDLEFRPYLYKIPPRDALYAEFFKKIGVKNEATAVHYCNVLAAVYTDTCDKPELHPNQQKTVKRAVEQLFGLIKTQGSQAIPASVTILYLPALDGRLQPSYSLYYNDTMFETKRLEEALEDEFLLLERLSSCHLGNDIYEHHRLVNLLPPELKPSMLSQLTVERMVETNVQPCELGNGCGFSGWFDKHLSSEEFRYGIICLLREQTKGKLLQEEAAEMCDRTFGSIEIVCCKTLETMLWLNNQPLHRTAREMRLYVRREQAGCTFFLKHNDDMAPKVINNVNMTLIKEINALLKHGISSVHLPVLGQLLNCDDMEEVKKTLAENEIHDSAETNSLNLSPPAAGTKIPDAWHDVLDMSFLNNFEEGEYIGYMVEKKYTYGIIVEVFPGLSGRCSQRYRIEIGEDDLVEVSHLDMYQLKRGKKQKTEVRTTTSSMELEKRAGSVPHPSLPSRSSLPASFAEAKTEIDKCLAEIWTLPQEERQKAIRRLYLRWHPDKNLDCPELATEAFKYLLNRIDELSKGKTVDKSNSSRNFDFRDFYPQWNEEARSHRSGRERFSRGYRSYNFWTHNTNVPRPNKEEAQRWYKQARCDLDAAQNDMDRGSTEWCLFKVHQAVEKALIAAEYKRNGKQPDSSSISASAAKVSRHHANLTNLPQLVDRLKTLGVDPKKTQYPNCHPYPHIPNGQFRSENAVLALTTATELLSKVETYVK